MRPEEIIKKNVFITFLDWGLGHCARSIPIIKSLVVAGNKVYLGVTEDQKKLFLLENLNVEFIDFIGYEFNIPKKNWELNFLLQVPRLKSVLYSEQRLLEKIIEEFEINVVLSDHRYGLYSRNSHCIFMTHQLNLPAELFNKSINKIHQNYISKFDDIWVLDDSTSSIAGELSRQNDFKNVIYIGGVSRFTSLSIVHKYRAICIVSGPEPHRSEFSSLMKTILPSLEGDFILLDAQPGENIDEVFGNVRVLSHASTSEFNILLNSSKCVISRSGYTTIMDVMQLKKSAILCPTPGQAEQEYLANYHDDKHDNIHKIDQNNLSKEALIAMLSQV